MKLREWLLKTNLPSWAVLEYGDALETAQKRVRELEAENRTLRAYIDGMERGLRARRPQIVLKGGTADERSNPGTI